MSILLSLLPWTAALVLWKFLNVIFLVGSVFLGFRLFDYDSLDEYNRHIVWLFSFALSPTISVLVTGQTSFFVMFMILLTLHFSKTGNFALSGVALALALTKPQLTAPILFFLLLNRHFKVIIFGVSLFLLFTIFGLYISNSNINIYTNALERYAIYNPTTSHIAVGISNIMSHLFQINSHTSSILSISCGIILILILYLMNPRNSSAKDFLPLLFLIGPTFFRFNSYDLVFLIPFFTWSRSVGKTEKIAFLVQALCFALLIPSEGLRMAYRKGLGNFVSPEVYQLVVATFRSWILVLLLPPAIYMLQKKMSKPLGHASTRE